MGKRQNRTKPSGMLDISEPKKESHETRGRKKGSKKQGNLGISKKLECEVQAILILAKWGEMHSPNLVSSLVSYFEEKNQQIGIQAAYNCLQDLERKGIINRKPRNKKSRKRDYYCSLIKTIEAFGKVFEKLGEHESEKRRQSLSGKNTIVEFLGSHFFKVNRKLYDAHYNDILSSVSQFQLFNTARIGKTGDYVANAVYENNIAILKAIRHRYRQFVDDPVRVYTETLSFFKCLVTGVLDRSIDNGKLTMAVLEDSYAQKTVSFEDNLNLLKKGLEMSKIPENNQNNKKIQRRLKDKEA